MTFESTYSNFHSRKCIWKYLPQNGIHFSPASVCSQYLLAVEVSVLFSSGPLLQTHKWQVVRDSMGHCSTRAENGKLKESQAVWSIGYPLQMQNIYTKRNLDMKVLEQCCRLFAMLIWHSLHISQYLKTWKQKFMQFMSHLIAIGAIPVCKPWMFNLTNACLHCRHWVKSKVIKYQFLWWFVTSNSCSVDTIHCNSVTVLLWHIFSQTVIVP